MGKGKEILHIYLRVSTEVQTRGTSLDEQKRIGLKLSKENGLKPLIYNEGGKSSNYETWENRPKIQDIMLGIESGKIKNLYSFEPDRISRDDIFWNNFRTILIKNEVTFYTRNGKYSFNNPTDKLIFNILSSLGEYDNQLRMIRTHRGKMNKIKMGYWRGGETPFGYKLEDKKLVECKKESKWVKFIYKEFNKGKTETDIRNSLFLNDVKSRRGLSPWSKNSITSILNNTHYSGEYMVFDKSTGETIKCYSPVILDSDTVLTTRNLLEKRSRNNRVSTGGQKNYYQLKGLLWCKDTGYPYSGRVSNGKHKTYYCRKEPKFVPKGKGRKTHDNRYLNYEKTNRMIWKTVTETLMNSHTWKELEKERILGDKSERIKRKKQNTRKINSITKDIEDLNGILVSIPTMENIQGKSKSDMVKNCETQIIKLNKQKTELEREMKEFGDRDKWIDWIGKYQNRLSLEGEKTEKQQREFLNQVITKIDIKMKNKKEHIFDIHFKLPIVKDTLDKKKVKEGQSILTLTERTT